MPINNDFDPTKLLYYNPQLVVQSNIVTPNDAMLWALSNNTVHLLSNDDMISRFFDPKVFISDFKSNLDVSDLNRTIYESMLIEGFTTDMLESRAKIAPSIYHRVHLTATNTFKFDHLPGSSNVYRITGKALNVNDVIQLQHSVTKVIDHSTIVEILNDQTFRIDDARTYTDLGQSYTVAGIKVYDLDRIARINCLKFARVAPYVPPKVQVTMDPEFNPDLYRILYPDARNMGDLACFQDYIQRRDNDDYRIRNADDLGFGSKVNNLSGDSNSLAFGDRDHTTVHSSLVVARHLAVNGELSAKSLRLEEMTVTNVFEDVSNLNVDFRFSLGDTSSFIWRDVFVRGLTQDDYRTSAVCDPAEDNLITEWAIKSYVDRPYSEGAEFNDVSINGSTHVFGDLSITSSNATAVNMSIRNADMNKATADMIEVQSRLINHGTALFESNVAFNDVVYFNEPITMQGEVTATRIVADDIDSLNISVHSNLGVPLLNTKSAVVSESLFSKSNTWLNDFVYMSGQVTMDKLEESDTLDVGLPAAFHDVVGFTDDVFFNHAASFNESATFNGNIHVSGSCNVFKNVHASNVSIDEKLTVHVDAKFKKDILYDGCLIGSTVCIGPALSIDNPAASSAYYDASVKNIDIKGRAIVGPSDDAISLHVNGLIQATNLPSLSDPRVKKNIAMMNGIEALEAISHINGYYYHYMNEKDNSRKHLGFRADEVETWLKGAVITASNYAYPMECGMRTLARDDELQILSPHPQLEVGDMLHLDDLKSYTITSIINSNTYRVHSPIPTNSRKITKFVIQNLKTIDYTYMIAAAYSAIHHITVGNGTIIDDGSITYSKIAANAVGSNQIIDGSIIASKIEENAIDGTFHIREASIDITKFKDRSVGSHQIIENSITQEHLSANCIDSIHIIDGVIQYAKMASHSVGSNQIIDGSVGTVQLAEASVTNDKLAEGSVNTEQLWADAVTLDKMSPNSVGIHQYIDGSITYDKLGDASVGFSKLIDDSIEYGKLAPSSVGSNQLIDGSITAHKIEAFSVTTYHIQDSAITYNKVSNDAIGSNQIMNESITSAKIAEGSVNSIHVANSAITLDKLDIASVGTVQLVNNAVTIEKIADSAVGSNQLIDGSVIVGKIAMATIGSNEIAPRSISIENMSHRSIGSNELMMHSVLAEHLAEYAVASSNIVDAAITDEKLANGSIRPHHILDGSISQIKLADNSVGSAQVISGSIQSYHLAPDVLLEGAIVDAWAFVPSTPNIYFTTRSNLEDGCVGVGTTSPLEKLHVHGNIFASGSVMAASDARLKTDITKIENALDKVCQLSGYTYYRKDLYPDKRMTGLLAQEVAQVLPEAVHQQPNDGLMQLSYGEMLGLIVESIKDLRLLIATR